MFLDIVVYIYVLLGQNSIIQIFPSSPFPAHQARIAFATPCTDSVKSTVLLATFETACTSI